MSKDVLSCPWEQDLLGYKKLGTSFTTLLQTVGDSKVISIEAGFGHGKTFFRKAWAQQLRDAGEIVVELDAQRSDRSGDPVVTFLGALLERVPEGAKTKANFREAGKKYAGVAARTVARAVLRHGADELIGLVSKEAGELAEGKVQLQEVVDQVEEEMSKTASRIIATQLATEKAINSELPEQIDALRNELTKDVEHDRVIILVDELDRCHPEYAISLLETMKHVFDRPGFVFCFLVNADYLERVAQHRFGAHDRGEQYLDKFVDLRLRLVASPSDRAQATKTLAQSQLDVGTPFGDAKAFSATAAAELAGKIVEESDFSMRQVKRTLDRVEVALRCYPEKPLDRPLLVFLAFKTLFPGLKDDLLPRAALTPERSEALLTQANDGWRGEGERAARQFVSQNCRVLEDLDESLYQMTPPALGYAYETWVKILSGLGPHYLSEHLEVLDAAHSLLVSEGS